MKKIELINDWKKAYKYYSVIFGVLSVVCGVCNDILPMWEGVLTPNTYTVIAAILGTVGVVGRVIKQKEVSNE